MKLRPVLAPIVGTLSFFGVWELVVRVGNLKTFELRAPSQILNYLLTESTGFPRATVQTGYDALRATLLAAVVGFALGAVMAASRWVEEGFLPVLILIQVTPWVAYSATVVQWLGGGSRPVVFVATLVCVPAFAFAAAVGLRSADPAALELLRSVDASRWETLWRVRLPQSLPAIFVAARFATGLSLAAVFYTEGGALSNRGLGAIFRKAFGQQTLPVWSTAYCAAFLGAVGLIAIGVLERVLLGWHASQRHTSR